MSTLFDRWSDHHHCVNHIWQVQRADLAHYRLQGICPDRVLSRPGYSQHGSKVRCHVYFHHWDVWRQFHRARMGSDSVLANPREKGSDSGPDDYLFDRVFYLHPLP